MAWTTPKTWSVGEVLTAANMNIHLRDNQLAEGPHLIARKASDESVISSTALQDDNELFTPSIAANEVWLLTLLLSAQTDAGGMKSSFSIPTSSTMQFSLYDATTGNGVQLARITATDGSTLTYLLGLTAPRLFRMETLFINAGTAGAVTFRWAQTSSNGAAAIVKANSTLWGVKLA
jgi:hypothetical protein